MTTEEKLKKYENLIFESVKLIDLCNIKQLYSTSEIYKSYSSNKFEKDDEYIPKFTNYLLKQVRPLLLYNSPTNKMLNQINFDSEKNVFLTELFGDIKIFNVNYFRVWGDVLEHKDPTAKDFGYPVDTYESLLMPIKVPRIEENKFKTVYGNEEVILKEGKFMKWDVCNIPHYWKFTQSDPEEYFELLHIDYMN